MTVPRTSPELVAPPQSLATVRPADEQGIAFWSNRPGSQTKATGFETTSCQFLLSAIPGRTGIVALCLLLAMKTQVNKQRIASLAATVAAEDLRCGDFVGVLHEIIEVPSFLCGEGYGSPASFDPIRVPYRPRKPIAPLRVEAICLPFVFLKSPKGQFRTMDIRQVQFARLDEGYAKVVWQASRPKSE